MKWQVERDHGAAFDGDCCRGLSADSGSHHIQDSLPPDYLAVYSRGHQPMRQIPYFAHVTRPIVSKQQFPGFIVQPQPLFARLPLSQSEEMFDEGADILAAFAKRWEVDPEHVEPIVEVVAEPSR